MHHPPDFEDRQEVGLHVTNTDENVHRVPILTAPPAPKYQLKPEVQNKIIKYVLLPLILFLAGFVLGRASYNKKVKVQSPIAFVQKQPVKVGKPTPKKR